MSIWSHDGIRYVKQHMALLDNPSTAFLCCPGPSLSDVPSEMRGIGRTIYAINSAYPKVKPDVWIGLDTAKAHADSLWFEPFPKVTRYIKGEAENIRRFPNVLLADIDDGLPEEILTRRGHDSTFIWCRNTLMFALHFIVYRGHKRIHFVGCNLGGKSDYHDGRTLAPEQREYNNPVMAKQAADLQRIAPLFLRHGIELVGSTPDSPLNNFLPFVPLEEALLGSENGLPSVETAPLLPLDEWRKLVGR